MRQVFDVNVLGAYLVAREAARRMNRSRGGNGGSLVLISSVAARIGAPDTYVDYAGVKGCSRRHGAGLVEGTWVARACGSIRSVRASSKRKFTPPTANPRGHYKIGASTPLGRPGTANEIAETIVWLLSDASSYVTGAIIDVTGGR